MGLKCYPAPIVLLTFALTRAFSPTSPPFFPSSLHFSFLPPHLAFIFHWSRPRRLPSKGVAGRSPHHSGQRGKAITKKKPPATFGKGPPSRLSAVIRLEHKDIHYFPYHFGRGTRCGITHGITPNKDKTASRTVLTHRPAYHIYLLATADLGGLLSSPEFFFSLGLLLKDSGLLARRRPRLHRADEFPQRLAPCRGRGGVAFSIVVYVADDGHLALPSAAPLLLGATARRLYHIFS